MTRTVSGHAHDANHDLHFPKRRLQHVFAKDGRALIVAMDGARNGPAKGLENPRQAVRNVVAGGADAILTTPGMAKATADQLRGRGLIIGLDAEDDTSDYGVEASLRFGADAVELKVFPGNPDDTKLRTFAASPHDATSGACPSSANRSPSVSWTHRHIPWRTSPRLQGLPPRSGVTS